MLIGLGIDFGIQVISRYDEEMLENDPRGAGERHALGSASAHGAAIGHAGRPARHGP